MLTITKEFVFGAAHRLYQDNLSSQENRAIYGKCCNLHGHTYRLRITVAGVIDTSGMIIHFADLKKIVIDKVISRYDQTLLNEVAEFKDTPTTAENMVCHIFGVLDKSLAAMDLQLTAVTLFETPTSWATMNRDA
jgi:6-pyruvoyltetrahydropterin/6-carboxytetrahydropterin synthase